MATARSSADQPYVELFARGAQPLPERTVEQAILNALAAAQRAVVLRAGEEVKNLKVINPISLTRTMDTAWQMFLPSFGKITTPYLARAYAEGYRQARAGDVPPEVINALAEDYATRMGTYFHTSSREAVIQGFNTFVNRKVATRVAAERALEAYGLTPRQMGGVTSAQFDQKVDAPISIDLKRRLRDYLTKSLFSRLSLFATQETHNLTEQARQTSWMWMVASGQLSATAEKVWLTARDERVCAVCGPLHGQRVRVGEKFTTSQGELWTPGAHVNCRCEVRLVTTELSVVQKDRWYNDEFVRSSDGRFATKRVKLAEDRDTSGFQSLLDEMFAEKEEVAEQPVSFARPVTNFRGSLRPLSFTEKKPVSFAPQQPVSFTGTPEPISFAPSARPLQPERSELSFAQQREAISFALTEAFAAPPKPRTQTRYRDTIVLDRPAFAVVEEEMFDHDGRVMLTFGTTFYTDQDEAITQAHRLADELRQAKVDEIKEDDADTYEIVEGDSGTTIKIFEDDVIHEVMDWVLHQQSVDDPDWDARQTQVRVEVYDDDHNWVGTELIPVEDAAHHLGIIPSELMVRVARLTEGYANPAQGSTTQLEAGTKHGLETWATTGNYQWELMGREMYEPGSRMVQIIDLIPEVSDEVLDD